MKKFVALSLCLIVGIAASFRAATAVPPFSNEFKSKYIKPDGDEKEKKLAEAYGKVAGCLICHEKDDKGKANTKKRNAYGKALGEHIKKADSKDKEKIQKALDTVFDEKIDKEDKEAKETWGDRIKEGKLPVEIEEEEKK